MSKQLYISANDKNTADAIVQGLNARKIKAVRRNHSDMLRFGMKIGPAEGTSKEWIEILEASPQIAEAIWDTVEVFINRISFYLNQKPVQVSNKQSLKSIVEPKTFKDMFGR
ncbi:MAG TPA: hypothetical protein VFY25_06930 [Anaerolineales bacterium]|nr:hypothetical protein [Anaerolineales bacterium]